jgi:beta-glucanase (GH16 family)
VPASPAPEPLAISGKGYRLMKNWDFVTGIRSITALQAEFYPFYVYSNGTLNYLNDEWQRYRDFTNGNHVFTAEGLALRAFLKSGQPLAVGSIDSGMLRSKWIGKYGYFEAKVKVPAGRGTWPAFWLNPQDGKWPPEIDVLEIVNNGRDSTLNSFHFVHGAGTQPATSSLLDQWNSYRPGFDYKDGFHTFAVEWTPDRVRHFVDDKLVVDRPYRWIHNDNTDGGLAHVLLNLAVGGSWPGAPTTSSLPAELVVKHIRVWQK